MEELKRELEKLSKTYVDTPEKEEKILIPFIKRLLELSVKERRKLLPTIRELQWIKGKFSETFCDHHRARFLGAVQFVCGNKREMDLGYHIDFNLLCKLLSLYTPSWLAEYINDAESYLNFNISYEQAHAGDRYGLYAGTLSKTYRTNIARLYLYQIFHS